MNGSDSYRIVRSKKFERDYDSFIKRHYRKDKRSRRAFEELVDATLDRLRNGPDLQQDFAMTRVRDGEKDPNFTDRFYKVSWRRLPGIRGLAGCGRLIYAVNETEKTVTIACLYSHDEVADQPSSKDLRNIVKAPEES